MSLVASEHRMTTRSCFALQCRDIQRLSIVKDFSYKVLAEGLVLTWNS